MHIWRLSEDLDFVYSGDFGNVLGNLDETFKRIEEPSGIRLALRSHHSNPDYLQLKIQYEAVLGKNWIKVDVTRELPIDTVLERKLTRTYSDYPAFKVRVESVEEIGAEKIRSLVERKKCRDYYDVWQLMKLKLRRDKLKRLLARKLQYKGIKIKGLEEVFPSDLSDILEGYWDRELGRLSYPVPELKNDLKTLITPVHACVPERAP